MISQKLSHSFFAVNFICTILVVCIHYNSLYHFDSNDIPNINFYIQNYIVSGISRIGVPFFALASGFFLFINFKFSYIYYFNLITKRVKSLLVPYISLATIVYIFNRLLEYRKNEIHTIDVSSIITSIITPETIQLWYVRDLFFLALVSPAIFYTISKMPRTSIIAICILWALEFQPFPKLGRWYIISIETFFFFSLGCFLSLNIDKFEKAIEKISLRIAVTLLVLYMILMAIRLILKMDFNNWYSTNYNIQSLLVHKAAIMIGIFSCLALFSKISFHTINSLAKYTFFVFLYHLLPLSSFILLFWNKFIEEKYLFYFTTPSALLLSFYVAFVLNKFTPKYYAFLTGGRIVR